MATNPKSFSSKEAIRFGWETTKKNFWFLLGVSLVVYGVSFIPSFLSGYEEKQGLLIGIINLLVYLITLGLTMGSIKIHLSFVDGKKPQFSDLFSLFDAKMLWRFFAASVVYGVVAFFGFLLLIIPGIYFSIKYGLYSFVIVDKNSGVFESFSQSDAITKNNIWNLFVFGLLLGLIVIAGLLALGVGLLVALPVVSLAEAYVYRKLSPVSKK